MMTVYMKRINHQGVRTMSSGDILENYFDICKIGEVNGLKTLTCQNFMGEIEKNYLYGSALSFCEYHYCAIVKDRVGGKHNTLSCSGMIMEFDVSYFFNPITPFILDFNLMKPMPTSSVDLLGLGLIHFYAKDIQTRFDQDIMSINCTNDLKTCLTFSNSSMCFGNMDDVKVVHSKQAVTWGAMTSLVVGAFVIFALMPRISKTRSGAYVFLFYILPIFSACLIYFGVMLSPKIPFAAGTFLVMWTFPLVYYSMRDVYNSDKVSYERIEKDERPF